MDVFHFAEFGKLNFIHHTIDTYSGFQWATALISEKADSGSNGYYGDACTN